MRVCFGTASLNNSFRGPLVVEADIAFHEAVCKASGNRICEWMFSRIHRAFGNGNRLTAQLANPENSLGFHKEVYSAICLRRLEQARQKMMQHLTDTRILLLRASTERGLELHDLTSIEPCSESGVAGQNDPPRR